MNGDKYQLKGVSTHGITWFPDYVNKEAFETLRDDWGANLIRLAMYTDTGDSYGYCSGGDKDEILALVDKGVSAATELGMYVIVDWHILSDSDPNNHIDDAKNSLTRYLRNMRHRRMSYMRSATSRMVEPSGAVSSRMPRP